MKRIVLLAYDYPPNNGGISRLCGDIISGLKRKNIPYLVVTSARISNSEPEDDPCVIRFNNRRGRLEYEIIRYLRNNITANDIIICDTWHPAASLCVLAHKKYFILAHGAELLPGSGMFRRKIWPYFRRIVLNGSEGIIANSHYTAGLVKNITSRPSVIALLLPVNSELFHPTISKNKDGILRVCSISRLEKFKAHDFLIKTIGKLEPEYKNRIRLSIGGKGPYFENLKELTKSLNLESLIDFLGFVDSNKMNDFYSSNDLFILCTREEPELRNVEGFGLVFTEAQACGTAVIGTRAGGIPDAIKENEGGWLIQQDNAQELLCLLKSLIVSKDNVHKQGQLARERVIRDCNIDKYIDKLLTFLKY